MICALLIFQTPQLDGPIGWYSPWLDRLIRPKEEIFARLEGQQHRRFIKTHTKITGSGQILKSAAAFFRRGTSGAGAELLTDDELAHYYARAAGLAPAEMLRWLHRP